MAIATVAAAPTRSDATNVKIAIWTVLFQIAWFWRKIPLLLSEGALPDTDDFQRLSEVRAWLGGQGWYDLVNHRMDPPLGADMHWSRLVDVPIAFLIRFFGLFVDPLMAERLTALVWPTILLLATVYVVLAICRRLDPTANPLLALLFTVTCLASLSEFMPSRIDHHNVQILLFCTMLLGLVSGSRWWGHMLLGAAAAASISVGLDAILIIVALFAWLGLEWVIGRDAQGRALRGAAIGLAAATPVLFLLNFPPSQWLAPHCDANSIVYFVALMGVALAYGALCLATPRLTLSTPRATLLARLGAGALAGGGACAAVLALYPQCALGPYGEISPELASRWLVQIEEARGLLQLLQDDPGKWMSSLLYGLLLLAVSSFVLARRLRGMPQLLPLYATFVISLLASLLQFRAMRIGAFSSIPFCVLFVEMAWAGVRRRFGDRRILAGALQAGVLVCLASPAWLLLSAVLAANNGTAARVAGETGAQAPGWRAQQPYMFCNRQSDYAAFAGQPAGLVMSDVNSGPAIPVFTSNFSVGGPYHRNGRAILDMMDFFRTDMEKPRRIAAERAIDYVAWCEPVEPLAQSESGTLAAHLARGEAPDWLVPLSAPGDRLHVYKVLRN